MSGRRGRPPPRWNHAFSECYLGRLSDTSVGHAIMHRNSACEGESVDACTGKASRRRASGRVDSAMAQTHTPTWSRSWAGPCVLTGRVAASMAVIVSLAIVDAMLAGADSPACHVSEVLVHRKSRVCCWKRMACFRTSHRSSHVAASASLACSGAGESWHKVALCRL